MSTEEPSAQDPQDSRTERKRRRQASEQAPAPPGTVLNTAVLVLAAIGLVLTAYLSIAKWGSAELLACTAGSGCDLVQSSRWSMFLKLPIAFWGMLTYAAVGACAWRTRRRAASWRFAWVFAGIGVAISIYLTAISAFVIDAVCVYCLSSLAIISTIFVLLSLSKPVSPLLEWRVWAPVGVLLAGTAVAGMHLHYSGVFDPAAGPENPYLRGLAIHLSDSGARFYGASWCPHCREELSVLSANKEKIEKDSIKVILVDVGENESLVDNYIKKNDIQYDVFLDVESEVADSYGLVGVPTFYFVNEKGIVEDVQHSYPKDLEKVFSKT